MNKESDTSSIWCTEALHINLPTVFIGIGIYIIYLQIHIDTVNYHFSNLWGDLLSKSVFAGEGRE